MCVIYRGPAIYTYIQGVAHARVINPPARGSTGAAALLVYATAAAVFASPSRHHRVTWSRLRGHSSHTHHPHLGTYIIPQMIFIFIPRLDGKRFADSPRLRGICARRRHIISPPPHRSCNTHSVYSITTHVHTFIYIRRNICT